MSRPEHSGHPCWRGARYPQEKEHFWPVRTWILDRGLTFLFVVDTLLPARNIQIGNDGIDCVLKMIILFVSGLVGGMRYVRRSSRPSSGVVVRIGRFVARPVVITTLSARWHAQDTSGCNRKRIGVSPPSGGLGDRCHPLSPCRNSSPDLIFQLFPSLRLSFIF